MSKRAELDPRTLRWVARAVRSESVPKPFWSADVSHNKAMLKVAAMCRKEARAIERKRPKLTPATTLCGPHDRKHRKPVKG